MASESLVLTPVSQCAKTLEAQVALTLPESAVGLVVEIARANFFEDTETLDHFKTWQI